MNATGRSFSFPFQSIVLTNVAYYAISVYSPNVMFLTARDLGTKDSEG